MHCISVCSLILMTRKDLLEFRKKHDTLKVKLVDGTTKTMLVDLSLSVPDVIEHISKKIGLKNPEEYGLQIEGNEGWLHLSFQIHLYSFIHSLDAEGRDSHRTT